MTYNELIDHYGNQMKAAAAIGVSLNAVKKWAAQDRVPRLTQLAIQTVSKNKLRADEECFK